MNTQSQPLELRLYTSSLKILQKLISLANASFIGFWLGFLKKEHLHLVDQSYYDKTKNYYDQDYNKSGFWDWERKVLDQYFCHCKHLLVGGTGGGREVLELLKSGYSVDGFECNPSLAKFANDLIKSEGFLSEIIWVERDQCPMNHRKYDGIIVGWGAYMLIQGRTQRILFLKNLKSQIKEKSPILLSFFHRRQDSNALKTIVAIGNVMRWILRRESLELGDYLAPNYVHYFTKEEIANELKEGGFELEMYSTDEYGHAVGIAN
ncbi:MAG: SAM-dependent methyltransferase [Cyanobacteria bacterium P01_A01_bin.123]